MIENPRNPIPTDPPRPVPGDTSRHRGTPESNPEVEPEAPHTPADNPEVEP
jgi:hypothetical protein